MGFTASGNAELEARVAALEAGINAFGMGMAVQLPDNLLVRYEDGDVLVGGIMVHRSRLETGTWDIEAAGWVDPVDTNGLTVRFWVVGDNGLPSQLGSPLTITGGGFQKFRLGPTPLILPLDDIVCLRVGMRKLASGISLIAPPWTLYLS